MLIRRREEKPFMTLGVKKPLMTHAPPKLFQPIEEKLKERELVERFAREAGARVINLQPDKDNGKEDGRLEYDGDEMTAEARRKGFPNHKGESCNFRNGWDTKCLKDGGIYLNESTIQNHKDEGEEFFVFIVEIDGYGMRAAKIDQLRMDYLLSLPLHYERSTNSGNNQSVKGVPVSWFIEVSVNWFTANHEN